MVKRFSGAARGWPAWYRRLGGLWGIGSAIVAVSLIVLWHHSHLFQLGYETERLEADKSRLERLQRQLLIERESLASLDRVERLAADLGLGHPAPRDVVLVRVDPPPVERDQPFAVALGRRVLPAEAHAAP